MNVIKTHIAGQDRERRKYENVDLEERIRKIREKNIERERRFKEVEDDKMQALNKSKPVSLKEGGHNKKEQCPENRGPSQLSRKGVVASNKKMLKGRGRRLLELSQEPLKAREFQSKAKERLKMQEEKCPSEEDVLGSKSNPLAEDTHKSKNHDQRTGDKMKSMYPSSDVASSENNPFRDELSVNKAKESDSPSFKGEVSEGEVGELLQEKVVQNHGCNSVQHTRMHSIAKDCTAEYANSEDMKHNISKEKPTVYKASKDSNETDFHCEREKEKGVLFSEDTAAKEIGDNGTGDKTGKVKSDGTTSKVCQTVQEHSEQKTNFNVAKEGVSVGEREASQNDSGFQENINLQKVTLTAESKDPKTNSRKDQGTKPKLSINTKMKKTPSSSSFDEAMSVFTPLEVPTNWGDCDENFNDDNYDSMFN